MDQSINELIAKLQTGILTHPQFLAQMKKLDSPQQTIQRKEQKVERAKKTRFMNKAKASHSIATQKANDTIAQGNALIQKMNMQTDMKAMYTLQSQIKAQSKKTFEQAEKLIEKLDKMYPDKQILELPKIAMSLDKQKRKLGVEILLLTIGKKNTIKPIQLM